MEKLEYVVRVNAGQKVQPKIISIRGTTDMFDRYKMRQLFVQVIGKGKMIRTVFLNVDDVAKDLKTEPAYLGAYFGYELGSSSKYDAKKSERERASISGEYDTQQLSQLMKKFVREIVQCPNCHLPEITLSLDKKTSDITCRCSSCSHTGVMKVDNSKFLKFMTTHPPTVVNTKNIQAKQAAKQAAAAGEAPEAANGDKKDDKEAKPAAASSEARPKAAKPKPRVDEVDDNDWAVSTDADAVKQRMAELLPSAAVKALVAAPTEAPASLTPEKAAEEWKAFLAKPAAGVPADFAAELERIAAAAKFDAAKTAVMAFDARFTAQTVSTKDILKNNSSYLVPFLEEHEAQLAILTRLEEFCSERPELIKTKKITSVMKELYDEGLVTEEAVFEWHGKVKAGDNNASAVRKEVEVLVNWLKTAEEEDEEEEDEEEEKKP